jgi:hypothetical protein
MPGVTSGASHERRIGRSSFRVSNPAGRMPVHLNIPAGTGWSFEEKRNVPH